MARGNELVELTVRSGPDRADAGQVRRVVVRPLQTEGPLRYQDWVAGRRAFVADRSAGRLGYLHVPDMMAGGWAQLHRDLTQETSREGLILDVRGNGGGHTSELVVEKLARKVIGWDVPRHRHASTYPRDAPRGPVVALADELSGSDGDIVTAAIKRLGIGPVVGVRTWGGVIGIDRPLRPGRRHRGHPAALRHLVRRHRLGGGEPRRGSRRGGGDPAAGLGGRTGSAARAGRRPGAGGAGERPAASPPDVATRPSRVRPELPPRP